MKSTKPNREIIQDHSTPRKCADCQYPADFWYYEDDQRGNIDKSSRRPVCTLHIQSQRVAA